MLGFVGICLTKRNWVANNMFVISVSTQLPLVLTHMKIRQSPALASNLSDQLVDLGASLSRLRIARRIRQKDAAVRAGVSRSTAVLIEKGSPSLAIGQVIRYLDAIAPGKTLTQLLVENDPAVMSLSVSERRKRARVLSVSELKELDF
jgi:DNA-binding XRE family transcriptional regulator